MRGRLAPALLLAGLLSAFSACGGKAADLFVLTRTGAGPGASLRVVVGDAGDVACNRAARRSLPADKLLEARTLAREIEGDARRGVRYPGRPGGVLSYRVRSPDGTVAWSDTSRPLPSRYLRLAAFARRVSKDVCGLAR